MNDDSLVLKSAPIREETPVEGEIWKREQFLSLLIDVEIDGISWG